MIFHELQKKISTPSILAEKEHFLIKLADNEKEVEEALRLRYKVFNMEKGKGLACKDGIDRDDFDKYCLHLVVIEKKTGNFVGTYRIHLGPVASSAIGFYSASEFEMSGLDKIANEIMEVGRSCVAPEYRSGAVVALLWLGIAELMLRSNMTYLLGCVSLETTEPVEAFALYKYFQESGKVCDSISAVPMKGFEITPPDPAKIEALLKGDTSVSRFIPPLFKGYLRMGAKVCGMPVFDKEFGTIDFLILLNTKKLPERYSRHFNYEKEDN